MLSFIVSFFRSKPQPTVTPDPRWEEYKKHLAAHHIFAAREKQIGFIPAVMERVDMMMPTTDEDVWGAGQ
jgi:hypothetical protein